jgi:hypothetical protein
MWMKPKLFTHTLTWRGVSITIDHHLDFLVAGNSRLEAFAPQCHERSC